MAAVPGKHQEGGLHQDPAEDRLPYFISWGGYIELNFVLLWKSSISKWKRGKEGRARTGYREGSARCLRVCHFLSKFSCTKQSHDILRPNPNNPRLLHICSITLLPACGAFRYCSHSSQLPLTVTKPTSVAHLKLHVKGS